MTEEEKLKEKIIFLEVLLDLNHETISKALQTNKMLLDYIKKMKTL